MSSNLFNSYVPRESNSKIAIVLGVASLCLILISTMSDLSESMSNNLSLLILVVSLLLCFLIQMGVGQSEHFGESPEEDEEEESEVEEEGKGTEYFSLQEKFNNEDSDSESDTEHFQLNGEPADNEPVDNEVVNNGPAGNEVVNNAPAGNEVVNNAPAGNEVVNNAPAGTEPAGTEPAGTEVPSVTDSSNQVPDATSQRYNNNNEMIKAGANANNTSLDIDNLSKAEQAIARAARQEMNKIRERRQETAKQAYIKAAQELKEKEEALKAATNKANNSNNEEEDGKVFKLSSEDPQVQCGVVIYDSVKGYEQSVLPEHGEGTDAIFSTIEDDWLTNQAWVSTNEKPSVCNEAEISRVYGTQARGPNVPPTSKGDPRSFNYDIQLCDAENNKFNCANLLPEGDPNSELCETTKEGNNMVTVGNRPIPRDSNFNSKVSKANGASLRGVPPIGSTGKATAALSSFFGATPKDAGVSSIEEQSQALLSNAGPGMSEWSQPSAN